MGCFCLRLQAWDPKSRKQMQNSLPVIGYENARVVKESTSGEIYGLRTRDSPCMLRGKFLGLFFLNPMGSLVRIPWRAVSLLSGDFIRTGYAKTKDEWIENHQKEFERKEGEAKRLFARIAAKNIALEFVKTIAKIVFYPFALIAMQFICLYGLMSPQYARVFYAKVEDLFSTHYYAKNFLYKPLFGNASMKRFCIQSKDYVAPCMQPHSIYQKMWLNQFQRARASTHGFLTAIFYKLEAKASFFGAKASFFGAKASFFQDRGVGNEEYNTLHENIWSYLKAWKTTCEFFLNSKVIKKVENIFKTLEALENVCGKELFSFLNDQNTQSTKNLVGKIYKKMTKLKEITDPILKISQQLDIAQRKKTQLDKQRKLVSDISIKIPQLLKGFSSSFINSCQTQIHQYEKKYKNLQKENETLSQKVRACQQEKTTEGFKKNFGEVQQTLNTFMQQQDECAEGFQEVKEAFQGLFIEFNNMLKKCSSVNWTFQRIQKAFQQFSRRFEELSKK